MFFACGSQDGSPAELKYGGRAGTISPFDTLIAEFDSKIVNIGEELQFITSDNTTYMVYMQGKTKNNKLYFVGKHDTTRGGLTYFKPGVAEDSIVFLSLENEDGYVKKRTVLYYSTHRLFDSEQNSTEATADNIDVFGNATDGVTFVGVLDSLVAVTEQGNIYDVEDYFKLELHTDDIIEITATSRDTMNVQFYGPGGRNKTISVKKGTASIKDTIGHGHLSAGDSVEKMVPFYIKVYTEKNTSRPNPYKISVLRKEGKLGGQL